MRIPISLLQTLPSEDPVMIQMPCSQGDAAWAEIEGTTLKIVVPALTLVLQFSSNESLNEFICCLNTAQ